MQNLPNCFLPMMTDGHSSRTLTWIATRSLTFVENHAFCKIPDADALIFQARAGGAPRGCTLREAFDALCQSIESDKIRGQATKLRWVVPLEHEQITPDKYFSSVGAPEPFVGCDFRPQELRNVYFSNHSTLRYNDFVFHDGDCLTPKGSGGGSPATDGSRIRWSWKSITFARDDVLRLWSDYRCVAAWKKACAQAWSPPNNLLPGWLNNLPLGHYVPIAEVVALLAFGPDLLPINLNANAENAARFRAGVALIAAAKEGKVTLCGRSTFRLRHFPDRVASGTMLVKISTESLSEKALVIDGARDWIGPVLYADEYPERGRATESVTFAGVTVHRDSLRRWIEELAGWAAPKKRGPKYKFDWDIIKREALRLMDEHGDFSSGKPNWNAQARLETRLLEFCSAQSNIEPSLTQLRTHLDKCLSAWRRERI